ncbi:MAG: DUF2155 domain-containing protein [Xanthobacteraceae bacterium]
MIKRDLGAKILAVCFTATGFVAFSMFSAQAQFGQIFGAPPRPPANVPSSPPAPAPLGLPEQMPPEEMDDDSAQPPPPTARATPPQVAPRPQQPGGAVRTQPLPPPPGATVAPPGTGPTPNAGLQPGQAIPPVQPAVPPPGQRPQLPPANQQPANAAPQPGDEIVTEMPSQKIANPTAVFAGLDKITGRIISFEVGLNEKVQFGALQVTPRVCYTRPPTESANTDSFVEVEEVTLQGEVKRLFSGWMFASSPGLHAVEHPIYDIWLTDCKGGTTVITDAQPTAPNATPQRQAPPRGGVAGNDPANRAPAAAALPRQPAQTPAAQPQQQLPPVPPPNFSAPRR